MNEAMTPEQRARQVSDDIDCHPENKSMRARLIANAIRAAIAAEREECAKAAKEYAENRTHGWPDYDQDEVCHVVSCDIAAAIRARGET